MRTQLNPLGGTKAARSSTLTLAGSPYAVIGDQDGIVTLPAEQSLIVEPGVILDFVGQPEVTAADVDPSNPDGVNNHKAGKVEFRVFGHIHVAGSAAAPVLLTSSNPWGWWGLNFYGGQSAAAAPPIFDHMIFEKARKDLHNADRYWARAGMWAHYPDGPVTVRHAIFRDNLASSKCGALDLMFTNGSLVEDSLFEDNHTIEINQFGSAGDQALNGGGAMCVTHGQNTVVRRNVFRRNSLEAYRLQQFNEPAPGSVVPVTIMAWPNDLGRTDLGGGAVVHCFQPSNDLLEDNLFEDNEMLLGPAAVLYTEDSDTGGIILRGNRFVGNRAATGGVIVCNRGVNGRNVILQGDNLFEGNLLDGQPAPDLGGDCDFNIE